MALFFLLGPAGISAAPCKTVLAYYTDWGKYSAAAYNASKIPFSKLTHICHAFILPNADGSLNVGAGYLEPALISGAHAAGVKVITSIGGSSASADANFRSIAASAALRAAFASSVKAFLVNNGYDGADIDWEFPISGADRTNFTLMVTALRNAFNAAPAHPEFLISGAYSWTSYYAQWYDLPGLSAVVDLFNIMTYDFHGGWSNHAGHNAPLGGSAGDPDGPLSTQDTINYFTSRGVPAAKINFGLPFYGYDFPVGNLFNSCGGGAACSGVNSRLYSDIQALVGNGWTRSWDAAASSPYLRNSAGTRVISYDDPQSIQAKSAWALNTRGLGGVFMWDLSNDYLGPNMQPLLDAMLAPMSCGPPTATPTATFTLTPQPIPGRVEAENYSDHYDLTAGNSGAALRNDDVDIEASTDAGGGYDVGWIDPGEWLEYRIQVASAGLYDFSYRVASRNTSAMNFQPQLDGANLGAVVAVNGTGGWQNWATVTVTGLSLPAGLHTLRLNFTTGGFNFNYADVARESTPTPSHTQTPTRSPTATSSLTATRSASPSRTATATATSSKTSTPTLTQTESASPSPSSTPTWSPVPPGSTLTATPTASPSATPSFSDSPTPSSSPSFTVTPTVTATPTYSGTPTPSPSASSTPTVTPSSTSSPSQTMTPSATPSYTAQSTGSATGSPTASPTATRTQVFESSPTALPNGPLKIEQSLPLPNPNPRALSVKFSAPAGQVELRIYSAANTLLSHGQSGPYAGGWCLVPLPPEFLAGAGNGVYFYALLAKNSVGIAAPPLKAKFAFYR